jgi:hypothetical protein
MLDRRAVSLRGYQPIVAKRLRIGKDTTMPVAVDAPPEMDGN